MKNVLLASTALVLTAGFAHAGGHTGISLSGEAEMGFAQSASADAAAYASAEATVAGTGETDGGLGFGMEFTVEAGTDGNGAALVYIEGGFGKLEMGDVDAGDDISGGPGANGAFIAYSNTIGDLGIRVSTDAEGDNAAFGASYSFGDFSVAVGTDGDTESAELGASLGAVGLTVNLWSNDYWVVEAEYDAAPVTITVSVDEADVASLEVAYDLGGGASANLEADSEDNASAYLAFEF